MTKAGPTVSTKSSFFLPSHLSPRILFEDAHLIVLSKPAGLLSQGESKGHLNLVDALRSYWGRHSVGLVHRLDRNTSGIMVVAKRTKAANRITQSLQEGTLIRTYLGWVIGDLKKPAHWVHFLEKNPKTNTVKVVPSGRKKASLFAFPKMSIKKQGEILTLVEFRLETGRSHQIRVQATHQGFPLLGDPKYKTSPALSFSIGMRMALHSYKVQFPHPISKEILSFQDDLPNDLRIHPFK